MSHVPGTGEKFLPWYKKPFPQHENINHGCTSYFVEPLKWMEPLLLGTLEGKVGLIIIKTIKKCIALYSSVA